jgi:hypothetical protein
MSRSETEELRFNDPRLYYGMVISDVSENCELKTIAMEVPLFKRIMKNTEDIFLILEKCVTVTSIKFSLVHIIYIHDASGVHYKLLPSYWLSF